jgi:hypothetical protein
VTLVLHLPFGRANVVAVPPEPPVQWANVPLWGLTVIEETANGTVPEYCADVVVTAVAWLAPPPAATSATAAQAVRTLRAAGRRTARMSFTGLSPLVSP